MLRKNKISLRVVLWTKDEDSKDLCPVAISITGHGARTYYNTGIKVKEDHFEEGVITKGERNKDIYNARITKLISDTNRQIEQYEGILTPNIVKGWMSPKVNKSDFFVAANSIIEVKNVSTKKRYSVEIEKLAEFTHRSLKFSEITPTWLSKYYQYLKGKGNSHNTAINAFKVIRHVCKENKIKPYPFDTWDYPAYKQPKRGYLTMGECEEIFKILDGSNSDDIKLVAAFFLLEVFSGIRVSDWGRFSIEKMVFNDELVFTTKKTDTQVRIPIELMPSLKRVIDYIKANDLKYTKGSEFANIKLKTIQEFTGIKKTFTTHLGRHSCASMWLNHGMSKQAIAAMLGITVRQVDTYAHQDSNIIANEIKRLGGL